MAAELGDAAAAAAKLALKMGTAAADAIVFREDLGEELPFLEPVLKTINAIRDKVDTVKRNKEKLAALEERCTYITACVIAKHRQMPTSSIDVTPLKDCVDAVQTFVELCGGSSWRARVRRVFKASDDKDEIADLNARVDRLTGDVNLAGIVIVEGKIDGLKSFLEAMDKRSATKQEELLDHQGILHRQQELFFTRQDSLKRHQEEFGARLPQPKGKQANIPIGTPARKSWHVERRKVMDIVFKGLTEDGGPRLVGLVGDSGSGKTTTASGVVRSDEMRKAFLDGIVWLPVNKGANQRLPSLMAQLARTVYEDIEGSVGRPPAISDDGAAYIKQRMEDGHVGKGLKCLVVADNVWENEVVLKLRETGMWVLLSTRDEALVNVTQGLVVGVNALSMTDAKSVLRKSAELSEEVDLSDEAVDLISLCGRVAMDLAFVGRWSTVRGRTDRKAWSDAANKIRLESDKVQTDSKSDGLEIIDARRRKAILRAGFEDLAVGSDDARVPRLYLSLAIFPDGHAFNATDASVLLCDLEPNVEELESIEKVLETLERWTVVRFTGGAYRMHDAHSSFARESLIDRGKVRCPALMRWVSCISSLGALRSIDAFVLKDLWLAVKEVGGPDLDESCPYADALGMMDETDPLLRVSIEAMGDFQAAQGDWENTSKTWRRLLEVDKRELGPDHVLVLREFEQLAKCADRLGHPNEAEQWRTNQRETIPLVLAGMQRNVDAGRVGGVDETDGLHYVGLNISTWAPGYRGEVEKLLRSHLAAQENKLGREDARLAVTLYTLGACVRDAGRPEEARELLRRCLVIGETKLGSDDARLARTLHLLGVCARGAGRLEEAEESLRRCLDVQKAKPGREDMDVVYTLHELGILVRNDGRLEEAETLLRWCLVTREAMLGRGDLEVSYTLHDLGVCLLFAGRPEEAEELLRPCLVNMEAKLGRDDARVAPTLHSLGSCLRETKQLEEAEEVLRRCLAIKQTQLGEEDVQLSHTLYELGMCIRDGGRLKEAEQLLRRCLVIVEARLGRDDIQVVYTLHELGVCVRKDGRLKQAEELLKRSLAIKESKLGREDAQVAVTLIELSLCARSAGRLEEADQLLKRCLTIEQAMEG